MLRHCEKIAIKCNDVFMASSRRRRSNQTSGGRMEGYGRYHHRHSTSTINLMAIGASEYGAVHGVIEAEMSMFVGTFIGIVVLE